MEREIFSISIFLCPKGRNIRFPNPSCFFVHISSKFFIFSFLPFFFFFCLFQVNAISQMSGDTWMKALCEQVKFIKCWPYCTVTWLSHFLEGITTVNICRFVSLGSLASRDWNTSIFFWEVLAWPFYFFPQQCLNGMYITQNKPVPSFLGIRCPQARD